MSAVAKKEDNQVYSDFWLDKKSLYQYIPKGDGELGNEFSMDLIQLAAYRRIVSNFVFLLTHKDIPVQFSPIEKSNLNFTTGKMIYLSASIRRREDFDWSVGVALHEASHILLTDFEGMNSLFSRIPFPAPTSLRKLSVEKNLSNEMLMVITKWLWNYIEDRYIDSYTFKESPGYRGYYKAVYEKFWNSEVISKALKSKAYRESNLESYEYRILHLTNEATDLDALPLLREIAELISIDSIFRLKKTKDRMDLAYKVLEMVLSQVDELEPEPDSEGSDGTIKKIHEKLSGDGSPGIKNKKSKNIGNTEEFSDEELKDLEKEFDEHRKLINHDYSDIKEAINKEQEGILDAIEKSNIVLMPVSVSMSGDYNQAKVDCIVVKKMTRDLIFSGKRTFPMASNTDFSEEPPESGETAVARGFMLGKLLGRKLQIRGEENTIKYIRKHTGKIERRLLAGIGAGLEDIFSKSHTNRFNRARLHISIDSSGSMNSSDKWAPTITCVTAICVAASMVDNLDVSVSFRTTTLLKSQIDLPYIVLAYDSKTDKISKIRNLFPYLIPNGGTPEGLAFGAIAEEFIVGKKSNDQDHYFLNISDGEPCYVLHSSKNSYGVDFNYSGEAGALHTKKQVEKIRSHGVKVLSYFIGTGTNEARSTFFNLSFDPAANSDNKKRRLTCKDAFIMMYGKDAQFIDVENVTQIAKTINNLFLSKI